MNTVSVKAGELQPSLSLSAGKGSRPFGFYRWVAPNSFSESATDNPDEWTPFQGNALPFPARCIL